MMSQARDASGPCRCLNELLLAYLRAADAPTWPGADGVTLEEVLESYPQCAEAGLVPDLPSLMQQHPDLADVLRDFFAQGQKRVSS